MFFVLSPAKNLDENTPSPMTTHSYPTLLDHSTILIDLLKKLAPHDIAKLMGVSDKIALLNAERFGRWQTPFTPDNAKQAIFMFNGDVYEGLNASTLDSNEIAYLQQHCGILSGLYGILRPLDLILPYRLEMGTKFHNLRGKDLYEFWGNIITTQLNLFMSSANDDVLINLASQEYFKSIRPKILHTKKIITPIFKDEKNGQYKIISFYAKQARGLMMRYAAINQINQAEQLKAFDYQGYQFNASASNETEWVFLRSENNKKHISP